MTDQKIIAYDPGLVTGVAEGVFSETEPLRFLDGIAATYEEIQEIFPVMTRTPHDHIVVEKFDLRTDNEFAADLTGVRVEGILELAYGEQIVWRSRTKKSQVPDSVLLSHGLWRRGVDVDWEDGRDVNDAINHMLGYVAFDLRHIPTLRKYFKPNYGEVESRGE